ncbi:MAG TPA: hypothetical protein VMY18_09420, partial [Acidobacteriota bacterium]|nr:hypothetical protein [Acidobacteriota bacterium]
MAKPTRDLAQLIRPAKNFPMLVEHIGLTPEEEAALSRTFNRLAQLYHSDKLSRTEVGDCLLLLTTCRNEWYTLNAMLFEAFEWCREGDRYVGFGDALNDLMQAVSGAEPLEKAAMRAARRLSAAAYSLEQFEAKHKLFFERFEEVRRKLLNFSGEIADDFAREEFHKLYVNLGSGPRPEDRLSPDVDERYDLILERLVDWFDVVRPLTGLARTYITEVLEFGKPHRRTCADYLQK